MLLRSAIRRSTSRCIAVAALVLELALPGASHPTPAASEPPDADNEAEVLEVDASTAARLPGGDAADGIVGDWRLSNPKVEAVVAGNLPDRRANFATFEHASASGCLIDFCLRGAQNDQLAVFSPCAQEGPISSIRRVPAASAVGPGVEVTVDADRGSGLFRQHTYRLEPQGAVLRIDTLVRNESDLVRRTRIADRWRSFPSTGEFCGIRWADAPDPARRVAYATAWVEDGRLRPFEEDLVLEPGMEARVVRLLSVGRSPAEAVGEIAAALGPTGELLVALASATGAPRPDAILILARGQETVAAYPDADGHLRLRLPPGACQLRARETGTDDVVRQVTVAAGRSEPLGFALGAASAVEFDIRDEDGRSLPCKVQFFGRGSTADPDLGPPNRARGCRGQYHAGPAPFRVQLPPGRYGVIVTRGIEYGSLKRTLELAPASTQTFQGTLRRVVDTRGWVSADFHSHSRPSGDNVCATDDRLLNLAAEGIEFAPATEHNRICDWGPAIARLGLSPWLASVPGIELTSSGCHLNAFPFRVDSRAQGQGALAVPPEDLAAAARLLHEYQGADPDRWIQLNHADLFRRCVDATGQVRPLDPLVDGVEVQNGLPGTILDEPPAAGGRLTPERQWLRLLNEGLRLRAVAVSDAHSVHGDGVGGWRMYLPSATDEAGRIDWRELVRHAKAGRMVLTSGPFLDVSAGDGHGPGSEIRASGGVVALQVRVQCTDWVAMDRVQVLVNGQARPELNFTRATHPAWFTSGPVVFHQRLEVSLREDSQLIVVAAAQDADLSTGFGTSGPARLRPYGYHQPIYVEVDGRGWPARSGR